MSKVIMSVYQASNDFVALSIEYKHHVGLAKIYLNTPKPVIGLWKYFLEHDFEKNKKRYSKRFKRMTV